MGPKRRGRGIPIVEKLYKKNQEDYASAGGFDVNDDEIEDRRARLAELAKQKRDLEAAQTSQMPDVCIDCDKPLLQSYLWNTFSHPVCDACRKHNPDNYKLIARTKAKSEYLLKDEDLDVRRPILRLVSVKNPHNPRYGDMKLYLELQVKERAMQIHGSMEGLEITREQKQERKEATKAKKYENKIKRMQKELRSTTHVSVNIHEHDYDEEKYNSKRDNYSQKCKSCGFVNEFEKF